MDEIPIINQLPEKWRGVAIVLIVVVVPYLTRAWHAWKAGGGLYGVRDAILFGTNKPKPKEDSDPKRQASPEKG